MVHNLQQRFISSAKIQGSIKSYAKALFRFMHFELLVPRKGMDRQDTSKLQLGQFFNTTTTFVSICHTDPSTVDTGLLRILLRLPLSSSYIYENVESINRTSSRNNVYPTFVYIWSHSVRNCFRGGCCIFCIFFVVRLACLRGEHDQSILWLLHLTR